MACPSVAAEETKAQKNEVICSRLHQLKVELGRKPGSVDSRSHALGIAEVTRTHSPPINKHLQNEGRKPMI